MPQWEYRKFDLNDAPLRSDDVDMLNRAGDAGWELVGITTNNVAYFKRPIEEIVKTATEETTPSRILNGNDEQRRTYGVEPKYRDPTTNETWSGRGRMANWLKRKQEAGEDIEKYLA